MAPRTEPTNTTLLKEIKGVRDEQQVMRNDVNILLDWKRGIEIGKAAVDEYKAQQDNDEQRQLQGKESRSRAEILKQVAYVVGLIGVVLYAWASSKGLL